ncbi:hypothetical protein DNTS_020518 [Danionella cerebrum]|uniref:IF rod domain-containing protein n=1 Tax=Danionella cerebrum TaxID=2873325 RepID=A0A553P994_9TELE|nr:hypothetical protein DNTS_020518 [Danionella translucida]
MAMLRVSSYRKMFEEQWSPATGRCGVQAQYNGRRGAPVSDCPELDFAGARALNREAVSRFVHERSVIAALNDRLAALIDVVRALEEENECLEAEVMEMKERLESEPISTVSIRDPADLSLEDVIERLRKEREEILCDTEELNAELQLLQMKHAELVEQSILIRHEREDVSVEVDAITTDCLALREQVAIYEEQLAGMERQHALRLEKLCGDGDVEEGSSAISLQFPSFDITPAIADIKSYYGTLAQSLKDRLFPTGVMVLISALEPFPGSCEEWVWRGFEFKGSMAVDGAAKRKEQQLAKITGGKVKDVSVETDVNVLKTLIVELQKEMVELEKHGDKLHTEIEARKAKYLEEIEELENYICQLEEEETDLHCQMKDQSDDYEELLNQKMHLDIEIAAYR